MRSPVYIAAPFSAPTAAEVEWNVRRANLLAELALLTGLSPVLTHDTGLALDWEESPEVRNLVLPWGLVLVDLVAHHTAGQFWMLGLHPDLSFGMRREWLRWLHHYPEGHGIRQATWAGWEQAIRTTGNAALLTKYRALTHQTLEVAAPG